MTEVLIAEDNLTLQRVFVKAFEHANYDVDVANTGYEVKDKLAENAPAMIILDIGLPNLSGLDIIEYIREQCHLKHIKIIVVSGNHQAAGSAIAELADLVLIKPVSVRELVQLAERLLSAKRS